MCIYRLSTEEKIEYYEYYICRLLSEDFEQMLIRFDGEEIYANVENRDKVIELFNSRIEILEEKVIGMEVGNKCV